MAKTYKIGEAAGLLNLKSYVLRFWETEFPDIAPLRTEKGQRLYTEEHLALLERIRFLLHERGLTIGGARKILAEEKARGLSYVFGARGAVSGPDQAALGAESYLPDEAVADDDPEDGPEDIPADAPPDAPEDASEDAPGDDGGGDVERDGHRPESPSRHRSEPLPGDDARPRQYNLPGLEDLAAFRTSLLDSDGAEGYSQDEAAPPPAAERGMLPLFAVARAAFMAGRAGGLAANPAGGNFIQAGAGPAAPPGAVRADAGRVERFETLRAIQAELENLAALLRGDEPENTAQSPRP